MADVKRVFTVDGKPFFPVGGQSRNSSGYNDAESETAFKAVKLFNGNTLEIPVYWEQVEPEEGRFDFAGVDALLDTICAPGFLEQDQWEAQVQAQIQLKADVYVRSDNLTDGQIRSALLLPSPRVEDTLAELMRRYGPQASICILPEGPQTIPYISGSSA